MLDTPVGFAANCLGFPFEPRADDPQIDQIIAQANIPSYVAPALNRDITDFLAIGDSFAAGISADGPSDLIENSCSRFKQSYPNQMNNNPRFPGHATSRTFVFGACSGGTMQDFLDKQIELGKPDLKATYPKIGTPQIGTLSVSGNDLNFGKIVNACLYHWVYWSNCNELLKAAHTKLDDPARIFELQITNAFTRILLRGRTANPGFQLYITGYVEFWNERDTQCDDYSWAAHYRESAMLTTTLRADMEFTRKKTQQHFGAAANGLGSLGGVFYVDGWQSKYDGHRFCEHEQDPEYHKRPILPKTWFIHYESPYKDTSSVTGLDNDTTSWFDMVDSILIPPKDGMSTSDQIAAVNGSVWNINPAYNDEESMTAALTKLAEDDAKYAMLPLSWIRIMHPKGSGYQVMSDAVIDSVLKFGAPGADSPAGPPAQTTPPVESLKCAGYSGNKFMGRDDMNDKIGQFCADAAKQGVQDSNSGSTSRGYNAGTRYEVVISMDWPSGLDITPSMEDNCNKYMKAIMDDCDGNDPANNPLNWKHGGTFQVGDVQYNIHPQIDQQYNHGTCAFHLQEDEYWKGRDTPGFQRYWTYYMEQGTLKDGSGTVIQTMGFARNGRDGVQFFASDQNPLNFQSALPNSIVITPEAQGNPSDYIQFAYGSQSWTTNTAMGTPRCSTGGWSGDSDPLPPINRNMDCFFSC